MVIDPQGVLHYANDTAADVLVDLSGSAEADVCVTSTLAGKASGASTVTYSGQPAGVDVDTARSATLRSR